MSRPRISRPAGRAGDVAAALGLRICRSWSGPAWPLFYACAFIRLRSRHGTVNHGERRDTANAATVAPLSPSAQKAVLYGPAPINLPGTANFYIVPSGTPTGFMASGCSRSQADLRWRNFAPFTAVQAVRLIRQNGLLEVLVDDQGNGFISADI